MNKKRFNKKIRWTVLGGVFGLVIGFAIWPPLAYLMAPAIAFLGWKSG